MFQQTPQGANLAIIGRIQAHDSGKQQFDQLQQLRQDSGSVSPCVPAAVRG